MKMVEGRERSGFFHELRSLATKADAGSALSLLALVGSGLLRQVPWASDLHFPTLRWVTVQYLSDAIAYQINSKEHGWAAKARTGEWSRSSRRCSSRVKRRVGEL